PVSAQVVPARVAPARAATPWAAPAEHAPMSSPAQRAEARGAARAQLKHPAGQLGPILEAGRTSLCLMAPRRELLARRGSRPDRESSSARRGKGVRPRPPTPDWRRALDAVARCTERILVRARPPPAGLVAFPAQRGARSVCRREAPIYSSECFCML